MSYAKVYEGKQELSHNPVRHVSRSHCSVDAGKDRCTSQAESKLTLPQYRLRRTIPRGITSNIVWQALNLSAILQGKWERSGDSGWKSHKTFQPLLSQYSPFHDRWVQLDQPTGLVESELLFCCFVAGLFPTGLTPPAGSKGVSGARGVWGCPACSQCGHGK